LDTLSLGKHNPRLADIRKAIEHGMLTSEGLLPIEGWKLFREAQSSGLEINALFIRKGTSTESLPTGIPVYALEPAIFKGIQSTEASQGIIALGRPRRFQVRDLTTLPQGPLVILGGVQDPGNVGTILRIAESFQAAGCLGLRGTAAIYNPKTVRASAGSIFRLPCVWNLEIEDVLAALKPAKIPLVGSSPHAAQSISTWDWRRPSALLIGSEGGGLREDYMAQCDAMLRIPHSPNVESLNSAISAAVILYEAFKSRGLA
jgi:RNA methyltransferase, TrmH family